MRNSVLERKTKETKIKVELEIDGAGESEIKTGIGFFDHMLTLFAKHAKVDLKVFCDGDLEVDGHHTVEDVGIVLGRAVASALSDKKGITRYGNARVPMDEALVSTDTDISGRPYLCFNVKYISPKAGDFETALTEEFFRALVYNAGITVHINCEYGKNDHHIIEGVFKSFARAFRQAVKIDGDFPQDLPSTKGSI